LIKYSTSISLDGFTAGVDQGLENPIGLGGMRLHDWIRELAFWRESHGGVGGIETPSTAVLRDGTVNVGAHVMGRNMFGGGPGPWGDDPWNGWWGENPPFHVPCLRRHPSRASAARVRGRDDIHVRHDGVESAVAAGERGRGGRDVQISGGSTVARQALAAGLVDEIRLDLVPVLLGSGVRFFEDGDVPATSSRSQ